MKATDIFLKIYQEKSTVFTLKELSILFPKISYQSLKDKLSYGVATGKILHLRKGVYGKKDYNPLELVNKIYTPSYISLETVLKKEGIIFQEYQTIFAISYLTRKLKVNNISIFYRKIKNQILFDKSGINEEEGYSIASKERAFLDAVFLYKNYHFDNLKPLDWKKIFKICKIYHSKTLEKRVGEYYKIFKEQYA